MTHDIDTSTWLLLLAMLGLLMAFILPWWVTVLVCGIAALPLLLVSGHIRRALRRRADVGAESLPGARATVVARAHPPASFPYVVRLNGELWNARAVDDLAVGDHALVLEVEGNHLVVCRMPPELEPPQ